MAGDTPARPTIPRSTEAALANTCIKCGYTRRDFDTAPDYACPQCGVVYAKAEATHAELALAKARESAIAAAQADAAAKARAAAAPAPAAPGARADALIQQMLLAQANPQRAGRP